MTISSLLLSNHIDEEIYPAKVDSSIGGNVMTKQYNRIHSNQDKRNCYLDKGDLIEIHDSEGIYTGEITDIGLRVQNDSEHDGLHPCITIGILPTEEQPKEFLHESRYVDMGMFWIENINDIKVLRLGKHHA